MVNARFGTASTLVGRETELGIIREQLARAAGGQAGLLLISGEAGIGKSRLVLEARREFSASGTGIVVEGRCFETDRALPYGPFADLLRRDFASRNAGEVRKRAGHDLPVIARLLPELTARIPDLSPTRAPEAGQDRLEIVQAVTGYLERAAAGNPALLILEDLHWADEASLELIPPLARQALQVPMVMVCTYRSDEPSTSLRHMLAMLDRERLAVELPLAGLAMAQVDDMLRSIFDQQSTVRPDFLQAIYGLTAGNPFFVEEILRSLVSAGDIFQFHGRWTRKELAQLRIPRSVQDAVLSRSASVSSDSRRLLQMASVIGQRFEFDLLRTLARQDEARLIDLLQELVDSGLVAEESADSYRFHHALTREAVYGQMLARVRRAWHRRTGAALEERCAGMPERYLADLSYHFHSGERWEKSFEYARRAGERALSLFAPAAAVDHFTRALEAARNLGIQRPPEILRLRGLAYETLGDFDDARADFEATFMSAREAQDRQAEWQALLDLGRSLEGLNYEAAGARFEEALEAVRGLQSPDLLARTLNHCGTWYANTERIEEALAAHREALEIFEQLSDQHGIAMTLDYLGIAHDLQGDLAEMRVNLERAAEILEQLGERQRLSSTLGTMCCLGGIAVYATVGIPAATSAADAVAWGERARQLARETSWRAGEAYAGITAGLVHQWHGDLAAALERARECLAIAGEIDHQEWHAASHLLHALIYRTLRQWRLALEHLARAVELARASGSQFFYANTSAILVSALAATGDHEGARRVLDEFDANLPADTLGQRAIWKARAIAALHGGNADQALAILERLVATAYNARGWEDVPVLAWLAGTAAARAGRTADAENALLAAIRGAERRGWRPIACDAHLALSRLFDDTSRMSEADAERRAAIRLAREMSGGLDDDLRIPYLEYVGVAADPDEAASNGDITPLTPREREIAVLVSRGLSNRQIGDELFIGERTVETHVSNTLAKLGFSSRSQIAVWVSGGRIPDAPAAAGGDPRGNR